MNELVPLASSGYDRWHRWPMFFLDSSRHSRFPAKHMSTHTHTCTHTHARRYTSTASQMQSTWSNQKDSCSTINDSHLCVISAFCTRFYGAEKTTKTFILTMALNKDYRHPRKFCTFRAKFVSLGPSIRLTLSPSIYPKRSQSFYIEGNGLISFSSRWEEKMNGSPNVELLLFSTSEKLQKIRKIRFLSSGEFFISEFLKLTN